MNLGANVRMGMMKEGLIAGVLVVLLAVAQVPSGAEPVEVDFWNGFTGPDGPHVQRIINQFNREHEGKIRVRMVVMPWADFYSKLSLALRSRRAPDIGVVHFDQVRSVIEQGVVLELDPWLEHFPADDYVKSASEISIENGHHYGIALDFHPTLFYWNKELFAQAGLDPERPPESREEFLAVCKQIQEAELVKDGRRVWPCSVTADWPNYLIWQNIFLCNGGTMFSADFKKPLFDSEAGVDALQFLHDLIYRYGYSPANTLGNESMESFRRGTTAMELNGIWMLSSFKDTPSLNFGARSMINLGTERHVVLTGAHTMVLLRKRWMDEAKLEASVTIMRYVSDHSLEWVKANYVPVRYSLIESPEFQAMPFLPDIAADVERYGFPASHYRYTEGIQELVTQMNLCLLNKLSPAEAVKKAADITAKALAQDPD